MPPRFECPYCITPLWISWHNSYCYDSHVSQLIGSTSDCFPILAAYIAHSSTFKGTPQKGTLMADPN